MKTRILSLFVALFATTALWADFVSGDLWYKSTSDSTVEVIRPYYGELTSVTIPSTIIISRKTYSVTSIGDNAFYGETSLTSVSIGNSVTTIGEDAFSGCTGLNSITIPNSVTSIGDEAFSYCTGLASVSIGNSVTSIGYRAFVGCANLTSAVWNVKSYGKVNYESNAPFYNVRTQITSFTFGEAVDTIPAYLCYGMNKCTSIIIPDSVTYIGYSAFSGCTGLTSVSMGNGVTSIGGSAFSDCIGLTSITIPNSVTSVGSSVFYRCTGLASVGIGNSVTSIGNYAFYNCAGLISITIPNSVTSIGDMAFYGCTGLTYVTIPDSVLSIGRSAFEGCAGLTNIIIGNGVTNIGNSAFSNCNGLTSVTIPRSVTRIGSSAFSGCANLTSVVWNAKSYRNVTDVSYAPFYNVRAQITSFTFGDSVLTIPAYLCYGMEKLTSISISKNVTSIGKYAFDGCNSLSSIAWNAKSCKLSNNMSDAPFYDIRTQITSFTFGDSVKTIPAYLCHGMEKLTSISISKDVTSIGWGAFYGCVGLKHITIPDSVKSIGDETLGGCSGLTSIVVEKGNSRYDSRDNCNAIIETSSNTLLQGCNTTIIPNGVTMIGHYSFIDCATLSSITIPNSVIKIEYMAFSGCTSLTSITIPDGVTEIENSAFSGCTNLTSVVWNAKSYRNVYSESDAPFYKVRAQITSVAFGDSVETIPAYLCYGMEKLSSVSVGNNVTNFGNEVFCGCTALSSVVWNAKSYKDFGYNSASPFYNIRTQITSFAFGDSVKAIPAYLCYEMRKLTSISISKDVARIGKSAFSGCNNLSSIVWNAKSCKDSSSPFSDVCTQITLFTFGDSVATIPTYLCQGMRRLYSITIPNSVRSINLSAFSGCSGLASVALGDSIMYIGQHAFNGCTGLSSIIVPNSVTSIGYNAFKDCTSLESVAIGNGITSIGMGTFKNCTGLRHITIPNQVTSIGNSAFRGCTGLTSIEIPNKVTSIGDYAFEGCTRIASVTIGDSVTSIGKGAFNGCTGLTSIVIPNSVTSIGERAFMDSRLDSITIGSKVANIGEYAFYPYDNIVSVMVDKNNATYDSRDNCDALIETKTNTLLFGCKKTIIPNTIKVIADSAFYSNHSRSIIIPASVTNIGTGAFGRGDDIDTLYLLSENPPTLTNNDLGFNDGYYGRYYSKPILYIPCGTKQAYQNAGGWNRFYDKNIVEPLPQYTITVRTQNSSQGTASVTQANLCNNDNAIISATPKFGYQFAQWSDGSTDNPYTVEVTQDTTLTAMFVLSKNGKCGSNTTWEYAQSTLRIMGTGSMYSYAESEVPWRLLRDSIAEVEIADEVTSISNYAFRNCKNLTKITFPAGLTSMGKFVLGGCTALTSVVWNVKNIADYSSGNTPFYYYNYSGSSDNFDLRSQITSFTFGNEIESIPAYLCKGMENLTSITLPNSVTTIGNSAFCGCTALSSATMGNSVTTIGNYAFDGCEELLTLLIPNSITTIGEYAFRGCKNLETISFGAGLTSMGDYALDGCQSIYEMTCYATKVPTVSSNTFREVSTRADLYVPSVSVKKYKTHAYWGVFNVLSIGADPVSSGGNVTVRPGENDVIITWPTDDNADTYSIQITKDGQVFCTLVFNADGQLTNIAFAPARNGAARSNPRAVLTKAGYRFTVTGLSSGTHYAYDLTVKDYDDTVLQSYTGTFTTKGENITTDLDNIEDSDPNGDNLSGNDTPRKVFRDGQVYILRGGKTYTTTGMEIK